MHYFHLTPEQEDRTGYENPISIDRYGELCLEFDFDDHEYQSLIDDYGVDDEVKESLPQRFGKALDAREALLAKIGLENSDLVASYFAEEIAQKFEVFLNEPDGIRAQG